MGKKKPEIDLSFEGAAEQLTKFFFDVEETITEAVKGKDNGGNGTGEPVGASDEPEDKSKRIASPFNAKTKGKANKSGKGGEKPPEPTGADDGGKDDESNESDE